MIALLILYTTYYGRLNFWEWHQLISFGRPYIHMHECCLLLTTILAQYAYKVFNVVNHEAFCYLGGAVLLTY